MYIRSTGIISPQSSFIELLEQPASCTGSRLVCREPDYARLIDPRMIRRMSRIIKMGVAAATACLNEAGVQMPGAVITGTAYGCLADTDLFLTKMVENREELLTPTSFIQSTHNTVGAQIALLLKCHSYNNTFVHRGFSFESALLDAITFSREQSVGDVLVGAVDEITDTSHTLLSRFGLYKKNLGSSLELFSDTTRGTIAGEGAAFFLLSGQSSGQDYAELKALHTFYKPAGPEEIREQISRFLTRQSVGTGDLHLVITGKNGDPSNDKIYAGLQQSLFADTRTTHYKQFCGEYPTSAAFAFWLAAHILQSGIVPGGTREKFPAGGPKNILIYNHYQHIHHSLYLLTAC